jgi:hypothetical protein
MSTTRRAKDDCFFVYVLEGPGLLTKVGVTSEPNYRAADIGAHNPLATLVWHTGCISRSQAFQLEALAHQTLEPYSAHSEWFYVDTDTAILAVAKSSYKLGVRNTWK